MSNTSLLITNYPRLKPEFGLKPMSLSLTDAHQLKLAATQPIWISDEIALAVWCEFAVFDVAFEQAKIWGPAE